MTMRYAIAMLALVVVAAAPTVTEAANSDSCTATAGAVTFSRPYNVIRNTPPLSATANVSVVWTTQGNSTKTLTVDLMPFPSNPTMKNNGSQLNYSVFYNGGVFGNGQTGTNSTHFTRSVQKSGADSFVITITVPAGQDPKVSATAYSDNTLDMVCTIS